MAAITHPNLALILGAESWRGTPILVIEYLAGGMLAARIARAPLGSERALDLAIVMAHVLERAHGAGILHRDVKPSNIGYTDDGVPKLLDFGLARIAGDLAVSATPGRDLEATGLAGTPLYMSPEALAGGRAEPGFDLWSLAVVVFEAAGGIHPFERGTAVDTYRAIQRGFDDAVAERLRDDRPAVRKLFESALAPSRSRRPATASELAQELELAAASLR